MWLSQVYSKTQGMQKTCTKIVYVFTTFTGSTPFGDHIVKAEPTFSPTRVK